MAGIGDKITTVIPHYNGKAELYGCIDSLLHEVPASSIIVVDDGSTDGSTDELRNIHPQIRFIRSEENRGFAHAVNCGIRAARTPYVFLFNNDARLERGALHTLLHVMEETGEGTFAVQARMLTRTAPQRIDSCGDLYCALGWAFSPGRDADSRWYNRRTSVTSCCAGAALYRRDLLLELGLFDEDFFCYLEDVDLGSRARLHGYRNLYEPRALVLHAGSATSGSRHNAFKVRLTARNNLFLLYKNLPLWFLLLDLPLLAAGIVIKGVYFARKDLLSPYLKGLAEGLGRIAASDLQRSVGDTEGGELLSLIVELYVNVIRRAVG